MAATRDEGKKTYKRSRLGLAIKRFFTDEGSTGRKIAMVMVVLLGISGAGGTLQKSIGDETPPPGKESGISRTNNCNNGICPNTVATASATVNNYFGGDGRLLPPPDPDEPSIEYDTAKNFYAQGNYSQARKYFQLAYDKQQKLKGFKDKDIADYLARLGIMDYELARFGDAIDEMNQAEAIYAKLPGSDTGRAMVYNNLGLVLQGQGDYAKALEFHNKALAIQEKVLGTEHPSTATSYNNIGEVYSNQANYTKALEFHNKALAIREKVLGKEHLNTATTYNNIGEVYNAQGDYAKALELYNKALAIREKVLGTERSSPETVPVVKL